MTIAERRPPWDGSDGEWWTQPVAQLRYQPETGRWTLHWADRIDRWHLYDQVRPTKKLGRLLDEIDQDPMCIFFG